MSKDRPDLDALIEHARDNPPSEAELQAQRESWVRGEMAIGNDADEARERERHALPPNVRLQDAVASARTAYALLQVHLPLFDQFEREAESLESIGPIVDPTFFRKAQAEPWRQDVREAFRAAAAFVRTMDELQDRFARRGAESADD